MRGSWHGHGTLREFPMIERRKYRDWIKPAGLLGFGVTVRETDLWICADQVLDALARNHVLKIRGHLESYIQDHPKFLKTLAPWFLQGPAPEIVREMAEAGIRAGVGPMAAVAGAVPSRFTTRSAKKKHPARILCLRP